MSTELRQMAETVAYATLDAYSADSYTQAGWIACCRMLANRGFDARQIEAIMRSKWTRWAGDMDSHRKRYGQFTSETLKRYIDAEEKRLGATGFRRSVDELVIGTFGEPDAELPQAARKMWN